MIDRRSFCCALLALPLSAHASEQSPPVQTRRFYVPSPWGQLHLHEARPGDGGAGSQPPLVCLHQTSGSGKLYTRFLPYLATDRIALSVDTPGYGASDGPEGASSIEIYAPAIADALEALALGPVDLLGLLTGSMIAGEIARTRPALVRRLILAQSPMLTDEARLGMHDMMGDLLEQNWREQGNGYYVSRLSRMLDGVEPGPEAELAVEAFVETVLPGREFMKGELAAMRYPAAERFRDIAQPTLILALGSEFHDEVRRALDIVPDSRLAAAPELNRLAFRTDPAAVAPLVRAFLDGES